MCKLAQSDLEKIKEPILNIKSNEVPTLLKHVKEAKCERIEDQISA